jgi:hypothetical protein
MYACFMLEGALPSVAGLIDRFHAAGFSVDGIFALSPGSEGPGSEGKERPQHVLVSQAQDSHIGVGHFGRARALRKLSKRLRDLDLTVEFVTRRSYSKLPDQLGPDLLRPALGEEPVNQETVLVELSTRRFPSSVALVRLADGRVRVRKAFCPGLRANFERELKARRIVTDPRIAPVLATSDMTLYLPWYRQHRTFRSGLFRFYPVSAARNAISFLQSLNAAGYSMVDINPGSFLYDSKGDVVVVDFEFLSETHAAADFADSADYSGRSDGHDGPRARGWNHFWRDAVGAPFELVRSGNRFAIGLCRAGVVVTRLGAAPLRWLQTLRQLTAATFFYVWRRSDCGTMILGPFSRMRSSSLQVAPDRKALPASLPPVRVKYSS